MSVLASLRSRLAKDTFGYTAAIVVSRLPPFLLLPVYATLLPPEELGRFLTAMILVDFVQTVSGLGMVQALFRFFPKAADTRERKALLGTALGAGLAGGILISTVSLAAYLIPTLHEALVAVEGLSLPAFLLILGAGNFINLISILTAYVWAEQRAKAFFWTFVIGACLEMGLSWGMVAFHSVSLTLILAIECAKNILLVSVLLFVARRDLSPRIDPATFAKLFKFGVWLMPLGMFTWMLFCIDRFWLGQMAGLAQVGIYGFFYKFASPAVILFQGYIISLDSRLFKAEAAGGKSLVEASLARYLKGAGWLLGAAALALPALVWTAVRHWQALPEAYLAGLKVYPLLLATTYVYYWAMHHAAMLDYQLRSRRQLTFMLIVAVGNFCLCPLFITGGARLGIDAMSAVALSNLAATAGLLYLQSRGSKLLPVPRLCRLSLPVLLALGALYLAWLQVG